MGYTKQTAIAGAERIQTIRRTLWIILVLNLAVALAKLVWGVLSGSIAMQADGFHSLFDGTSNIVGLVGITMAARPPDRDHPYGHRKYETYASAGIGAMLMLAAYSIGASAVRTLANGVEPPRVDRVSFAVMLITLTVNIAVTLWERRVGKRVRSDILLADASHTASDALVSTGVIGGLILVRLGYAWADPVIALVVAAVIVYTAWGVFTQAGATLSDTARIPGARVRAVACAVPGVLGCHNVRTRGSLNEVYVDMHIQVDETRTVADGHAIAERVERVIAEEFPNVVDVIVHLEPFDAYQYAKTASEQDAGLA